eukprot:TRINITY_DN635_c1_g2_i2.p1 TRINITY_DN635_c1_g2~~TRINITY_DN635_c1_g2_i2.p1  ORF type:complete len:440 (+),score=81.57 TRINITY_DN635_c1_g2_i2:96-1322(+)
MSQSDDTCSELTEEELEGRLNMVPFPPPMSRRVKRILFTGGPNGGKTTALSQVAERLRSMGLQVFVLPDTSSSMNTAGVGFAACSDESGQKETWVKNKLKMEMVTESAFIRIAVASQRASVILFDRGTLDTAVYCTPDKWQSILKDMDLTEEDLLNRYDAVVHLTTTAKGAEATYDAYHIHSGLPKEEAIRLDNRLREVWSGHPMHKVIVNDSGGMEEKIQHAMSEICHFLGVQSPMLCKQQFLVDIGFIDKVKQGEWNWVHSYLEEFSVEITFLEGSTSTANTFVRRIRRKQPGAADSFAQCTKQVAPLTPKTPLWLPSCPSPPHTMLLSPEVKSPTSTRQSFTVNASISSVSSSSSHICSPQAQSTPPTTAAAQTTLRSTESIITKREYDHLISTQAMADSRTLHV